MKIMLQVPACLAIAGYLLLAGCIKDPTSPNNPKPEWLLEKITTTDAYQDDNGVPIYSKYVREYSYRRNKPWRCITSSNFYSEDTMNLDVLTIDTFYYDQRGRVKLQSYYSVLLQRNMYVVNYFYNGNEKLPMKVEVVRNDNGTSGTSEYTYSDTAVREISVNYKGGFDTTIFIFDIRGNYVLKYLHREYLPPGYKSEEYSRYDNTPNPGRFFNVENALPFALGTNGSGLPRLSQNNWTSTSAGGWDGPRIITLNAQGLVERTALPHSMSVPERLYYKTYYQYRRAD